MGNLQRVGVGCFFLQPEEPAKTGDPPERIVETAQTLIQDGAELLLAIDRGESDSTAHQRAMDALCAVCGTVDVPVIGTGEIGRLEDAKKLLYAGCDRVALTKTTCDDVELFHQIVGRFGADRLAVLLSNPGDAERAEEERLTTEPDKRFPLPVLALAAHPFFVFIVRDRFESYCNAQLRGLEQQFFHDLPGVPGRDADKYAQRE